MIDRRLFRLVPFLLSLWVLPLGAFEISTNSPPDGTLKIYENYPLFVRIEWNEGEMIDNVEVLPFKEIKNFDVLSFQSTYGQFLKEGVKVFFIENTYLLKPQKPGNLVIEPTPVNINEYEKENQIWEKNIYYSDEIHLKVLKGISTKTKIFYSLWVLLFLCVMVFAVWALNNLIRRFRDRRSKTLLKNIVETYNREKSRFKKSKRERALSLRDLVAHYRQKAQQKNVVLFDESFWRFYDSTPIEDLIGQREIENYIHFIEGYIVKSEG